MQNTRLNFQRVVIANRGEIACRVMKTAKAMGLTTIAVYSEPDRQAKHVREADIAIGLGGIRAADSYLRIEAIIKAAKASGAQAIHPGYGFLSENAEFADEVAKAGLLFIGPPAAAMRSMGLKDAAKALMQKAGVAVVPGYHGDRQDVDFLAAEAMKIGYPIMIKARAGGGGKGMRKLDDPAQFSENFMAAGREALASFGDGRVLIEKYIENPRHIEMQIFADNHGNVVHLWERDCSLQRRHQKVIEEAPAPLMTDEVRDVMGQAAVAAAKAIDYRGAGTIEFIVDGSHGVNKDGFWFMEMNTRLQVEHPVTEAIMGVDLVEWQFRIANGEPLPLSQAEIKAKGHAVEARLYAEDPAKGFLPSIGTIHRLELPPHQDFSWSQSANWLRIDSGVTKGAEISPYYDPMLAKIIAMAPSRDLAFSRLAQGLRQMKLLGLTTNQDFLARLCEDEDVQQGLVNTNLIAHKADKLCFPPPPPSEAIILAAMVALGCLPHYPNSNLYPPSSPSPWQELSHWRSFGVNVQTIMLNFAQRLPEENDNLDYHIELRLPYSVANHHQNFLHATINQSQSLSFQIELNADQRDAWQIMIDNQISVFHFYQPKSQTLVTIGDSQGHVWTFNWSDPLSDQDLDSQEGGQNQLIAPMPGLVKMVKAQQGQRLTKGQIVLVLEAMKMEHSLCVKQDCEISDLLVKEGDQVTDGQVLAKLSH